MAEENTKPLSAAAQAQADKEATDKAAAEKAEATKAALEKKADASGGLPKFTVLTPTVCYRGVVDVGETVQATDFVDGQKAIDDLYGRGIIAKA